jgi:hypothetical protein
MNHLSIREELRTSIQTPQIVFNIFSVGSHKNSDDNKLHLVFHAKGRDELERENISKYLKNFLTI